MIEQKGWDIQEAFLRCGFKISPFSYPRILARYQKGGWKNLLDTRGGNRHPKATLAVLDFIRWVKRKNPNQSAQEITLLLQERFQIVFHPIYIGNLLKKLELNNPRGRKSIPKTVPIYHIDHAGSFFLKGICLKMGIINILSSTVMNRIQALQKAQPSENLSIFQRPSSAIQAKLESLLYMPLFRMERILHFKTIYPREGLGFLVGRKMPYKYHTMDNFLREISILNIAGLLSKNLAKCYIEVFGIEFKTLDEQTFYIDCHDKVTWTHFNIPKGKHATRNQILKLLKVYFLHDFHGRPILSLTQPGDSHLTQVLFPLISQLEQALGKKVIKFAVFDREGLAVWVFQKMSKQGRRFITFLRDNQYESEEDFDIPTGERYRPFRYKGGKVTQLILDANKTLKDYKTNQTYRARAILIKDIEMDKLLVVVTNITRQEEPNPAKIVKRYAHRWEAQENPFKRMKPSVYLDTNHGLKGKELSTNRTLLRKRQKLEDTIVAKQVKIHKAEDGLKQVQHKLERGEKSYHDISQKIEKELKDVTSLLRQAPARTIRLLRRQSKLLRQKEKTTKLWLKKVIDLNSTIQEKIALICSHEKSLERAKTKLSKLPVEERLYEIDTSKDQFMTNLEVALTNADLYFKEHFLPVPYQRYDFKTIRDILYGQSGTIYQTSQEIIVSLKPYAQEPEHQILADYAARQFNKAQIYTPTNQKITMVIEKPT
ncbi:MAG: hypothetical protein ACE5HR_07770 [bacterium]